MGLEVATYIQELKDNWPLAGDRINEGDNHLVLLKNVLKATFPGVDGLGFKKAITATEDELNFLSGCTSNVQAQLNALTVRIDGVEDSLPAPAGTRMLFAQTLVPTGWSPFTTGTDDRYIRINDAGGGAVGGSYDWANSVNFNFSADSHALTAAEIPAHTHDILNVNMSYPGHVIEDGDGHNHYVVPATATSEVNAGGGGGHTHTVSDSSTSATAFRPTYFDVITGEKD